MILPYYSTYPCYTPTPKVSPDERQPGSIAHSSRNRLRRRHQDFGPVIRRGSLSTHGPPHLYAIISTLTNRPAYSGNCVQIRLKAFCLDTRNSQNYSSDGRRKYCDGSLPSAREDPCTPVTAQDLLAKPRRARTNE